MAKKKAKQMVCCTPGKYPPVAILLLIIGVLWLLQDLQVIAINLPWLPIALIVFTLGIMKHHMK